MSNTYNQRICNVNDIAKTLNRIMDTVTEGAELDIKIIPFENANNVAICYKEIPGSGGGSSLPEVTAADNGDVLTVVNGAWDKATPSGGDDLFILEFTDNSGEIICNKTFAELVAEYEENGLNNVLCRMGGVGDCGGKTYTTMGGELDYFEFYFWVYVGLNVFVLTTIKLSSTGAEYVGQPTEYTLTPNS